MRSSRPASSTPLLGRGDALASAAQRTVIMSTGKAATFTAGLVQMRSGLSPQANLDAAVKLIDEAKNGGADYVLTPEMTNILEVKRERLFAAIAPEESDASLAAFRELARKLGIFLHVGSLAIKLSAGQGGQSLVPDRPQGRDRRALRQDPHVRRRSRRRRELSRSRAITVPARSPSPPTCRGAGSA